MLIFTYDIILETKNELFFFLLENEKYDLEYALDNITKIDQLRLESSIVLIKLNRIEEAYKNILYCEQTNLIFYIKHLVKKFPIFDLLHLILKDIKANFPNNINSLYSVDKSFHEKIKEIKSHFVNFSNKEKYEKLHLNDRESFSIESIFIDILIELYDEYELLLVNFLIL